MKEKILKEFDKRKLMTMGGSSFECSDYEDICTDTIDFISQALDEYAKPKCDKCFDKGYKTELKSIRELSKREGRRGATLSDMSGEQINTFTSMEFCNCDRGKELEIRVKEYADWKIKELVDNSHCDVICECGEVHTFEKYLRQILSNKDKK